MARVSELYEICFQEELKPNQKLLSDFVISSNTNFIPWQQTFMASYFSTLNLSLLVFNQHLYYCVTRVAP